MGKRKWIGLVVIAFVAVGLIAYKQAGKSVASVGAAATAPEKTGANTIIIFADPREAESSCGCGLIFRAVRAARKRGYEVRETDSKSDPALAQTHHIRVEPTVLFLSSTGRELERLEGESGELLARLTAAIEKHVRSEP